MMSVLEYAEDVNRTVDYILKRCRDLKIEVKGEDDLLDEEAIILLDNNLETDEDIEEAYEQPIKKKKPKKQEKKIDNKQDKKNLAKKKKEMYKNKQKLQSNTNNDNMIIYKDNMTIGKLADALNVPSSQLIKKLFDLGLMVNINSSISFENAEILISEYDKTLQKEENNISNFEQYEIIDSEEDLKPRPPVVTIMGHVDHGKTTLLDAIRKSNIVEGEAGGITQAISAYQVIYKDRPITFIDTPGHAAFTQMRSRGAQITDIVIIIVAADDGVMPQTEEAIDHAKAAGVPILVAVNKIDKPGADPDKVMSQLGEYGLMPEQWGGDTLFTNLSALTKEGIDELLENILLISDMLELKANPNRYAIGTVIESRLDKHLGPITTVLIQNGTLRLADPIVVGTTYGKVRTLKNDRGEEVTSALPSTPVEITGLNDVPEAGDKFMAFESEKEARIISEERKKIAKEKNLNKNNGISLDELFSQINEGLKEINIILKADVNGSAEAVKSSLEKINVEGVKINVIRHSVGGITESDIVLAQASNAIIIGFNVTASNKIKEKAKDLNVEIRYYNIIYKLVQEMEDAMKGMLEPEYEEKILGQAEIKQLFHFSKIGNIAGCKVTDGVIQKDSNIRLIRDNIVIYDGKLGSLQREKDTVKEVKKGFECGITIENYNDIKAGDIIESYKLVEVSK